MIFNVFFPFFRGVFEADKASARLSRANKANGKIPHPLPRAGGGQNSQNNENAHGGSGGNREDFLRCFTDSRRYVRYRFVYGGFIWEFFLLSIPGLL
jgi:hypothetical protein